MLHQVASFVLYQYVILYLLTVHKSQRACCAGVFFSARQRWLLCDVQNLGAEYNMDVRVLGISGSSQMVLSEHGIDLAQWEQQYSG